MATLVHKPQQLYWLGEANHVPLVSPGGELIKVFADTPRPLVANGKAQRRCQRQRWIMRSDIPPLTPLPRLDFGPVRRMQQISNFIGVNYLDSDMQFGGLDESAWVKLIPDVDLSLDLLGFASDAVCWGQIAERTNDEALRRRAASSYGKALTSLTPLLRERNLTMAKIRLIIFGILMVNTYERMLRVPKRWDAWMAHLAGACALIAQAGGTLYDLEKAWDASFFYFLLTVNLLVGIALRQPGPYTVLSVPGVIHFGSAKSPALTLLLYCKSIPALLARVDTALEGSTGSEELRTIFKDIDLLKSRLQHWYQVDSVLVGKHPATHDSHTSLHASPLSRHLDTSAAFGSCFIFSASGPAESFTFFAMSNLVLACTLLRLIHFRPECTCLTKWRSVAQIKLDAAQHASDLCRSLNGLCRSTAVGHVSYAQSMAKLALNFFAETGQSKEMEWCWQAEEAIRLHEATLPCAQPPGMSGLEGLSDGVSCIGSYKAERLGLALFSAGED